MLFVAFYVALIRLAHPHVSQSIRQQLDLDPRLWTAVSLAASGALVPGLFGVQRFDPPAWALHVLSSFGLLGVLAAAARSRHRPLILGGLFLIVGGYLLTFPARLAWGAGLVLVQRYQLLPQLGLSLLLGVAAQAWLERWAARPALVAAALVVVMGLLVFLHATEMIAQSRRYRFPGQGRTLAALDRLGAVCRAKGVTREQAMEALSAFRPRWAYDDPRTLGVNPLFMLPEIAVPSCVRSDDVRGVLWAAMTPADRALLSEGVDVSRSLHPLEELRDPDTAAVGRLVSWRRVAQRGERRYRTGQEPAFLEYEMAAAPSGPPPRFLLVLGTWPGNVAEVWWSDGENWHEARSLIWFADPSKTALPQAVRLSDLPQWDAPKVRRVRLVFRWPGVASVDSPRLIR
jgi:hypothetical protein